MAILKSADQFKYVGRGPLDSKAIVRTYAELLLTSTWTTDETLTAYNGMIVAVWLDTDENNGVYFLHDKAVTKSLHKPDVTNPDNWHRLGSIDNLQGLAEQISAIQEDLESITSDVGELKKSATDIVATMLDLPDVGSAHKLYVVTEDAKTYIWHDNKYLPVGDGAGDANIDIQVIMGGNP
jgi:hypothetical protein